MWLRVIAFANTVLGVGASVLTMWEFVERVSSGIHGDLIYAGALVLTAVFISSIVIHFIEVKHLKERIDNFLTFRAVHLQERDGKLYLIITGYDMPMLETDAFTHIYEKQGKNLVPVGLARVRYIYRNSQLAELEVLHLHKKLPDVRKLVIKVAIGGFVWKPEL